MFRPPIEREISTPMVVAFLIDGTLSMMKKDTSETSPWDRAWDMVARISLQIRELACSSDQPVEFWVYVGCDTVRRPVEIYKLYQGADAVDAGLKEQFQYRRFSGFRYGAGF